MGGMIEKHKFTGPWILFGCSYAGSLAGWFKQICPNHVAGAVSSSAPIVAKEKVNNKNASIQTEQFIL